SNRVKYGYLGVDAIWITSDFKIKDVMLEIKYAPSPHTAKIIAELLYQYITSWNFKRHVIAIVSNNGTNIKSAFPILIQKERLEDVQSKLNYKDILQCIQDVSTRGTYVTLSTIISIIKKLIFDLTCESPLNNINYFDENTIFETKPFTNELLIEIEDEIISNISKRKVSIKNPLDTTGILKKVKNNIYFALIYYWNFSNDIKLMASLLDPCFKTLDFVESEDEKMRIIQKLHNKLDLNNLSPVESSSSTIPLTNNTEFLLFI
ncbi:9083_t:CDS:2, partial [Diversispora eburnea]